MNIVFFHYNGIIGESGGISRITETLGSVFTDKGHTVFFVGCKNLAPDYEYSDKQLFLPDTEIINSEQNRAFLFDLIRTEEITTIINQACMNPETVELLSDIRKTTGVALLSCIHNSILTPVYHFAYQKEFQLRNAHLSWLFHLLKGNLINKVLVRYYIRTHRGIYLKILDSSDKVIVLCEGQKKEYLRIIGEENSDKIVVVPNCQIPAKNIDNNEKRNIVLWVGTFDYSIKRPDYMLKIWSEIESLCPDWELYMLGDGPSWTIIKELSNKLNLKRVHLLGRKNPTDFLKIAKILCVTSVHESFSLVITEAHSYNVITVAFNSFTAASLVVDDGKDGYLVQAFDLKEYADTLRRLMCDNEKQDVLMAQCQNRLSVFSPDTVYNCWMKELN